MELFENDLFETATTSQQPIAEGAMLLRQFLLADETNILTDLAAILAVSPLRNMTTPSGFTMSVAMTNCGDLGWVSDKKGYRYSALDPNTNAPWQPMPASFLTLAKQAAEIAGYDNFVPDACLINQYQLGARMSLHQDKDEKDFSQPIVSVSLGCAAIFLFGGQKRSDKPAKIQLNHGDVIVWGGLSRLNYHGVMPLKAANNQHNRQANNYLALDDYRFNLTFRKAG